MKLCWNPEADALGGGSKLVFRPHEADIVTFETEGMSGNCCVGFYQFCYNLATSKVKKSASGSKVYEIDPPLDA